LLCLPIFKRLRKRYKSIGKEAFIWAFPSLFYVGLYFVAKPLGIVNIRALPQVYVFLLLMIAGMAAVTLNRIGGRIVTWVIILPLVFLSIFWVDKYNKQFSSWAKWNYSGWTVKPLYSKLKDLSAKLQGDFSMPRVIFEHNSRYNATGTTRVFEMLPYFARRSTLESLYMQSTILSPMVFHLQAEVSKGPSCPFWGLKCPKYNVAKAIARLRVMGVGELILSTKETIAQARQTNSLEEVTTIGPWTLFKMAQPTSLVDLFQRKPEFMNGGSPVTKVTLRPNFPEFKTKFYEWFKQYTGEQPLLVVGVEEKYAKNEQVWEKDRKCHPKVTVNFNKITLNTTCPGKAHLLKFSFHPTWRADTGDQLFLASPGLMGIVPSKEEVQLSFGHSSLWRLATLLSLLTLLLSPVAVILFNLSDYKGRVDAMVK